MTTTIDAHMPPGEPLWCTRHYEPSRGEAFHEHHFDRTWGTFDEKLRLGLTRFDSNEHPGDCRVEVQHLDGGGEPDGAVGLTDEQARDFTGAILRALATKKRASDSTLTLWFRCAYEAGRAFVAAVKMLRAASPRTASSHNSSRMPT